MTTENSTDTVTKGGISKNVNIFHKYTSKIDLKFKKLIESVKRNRENFPKTFIRY